MVNKVLYVAFAAIAAVAAIMVGLHQAARLKHAKVHDFASKARKRKDSQEENATSHGDGEEWCRLHGNGGIRRNYRGINLILNCRKTSTMGWENFYWTVVLQAGGGEMKFNERK